MATDPGWTFNRKGSTGLGRLRPSLVDGRSGPAPQRDVARLVPGLPINHASAVGLPVQGAARGKSDGSWTSTATKAARLTPFGRSSQSPPRRRGGCRAQEACGHPHAKRPPALTAADAIALKHGPELPLPIRCRQEAKSTGRARCPRGAVPGQSTGACPCEARTGRLTCGPTFGFPPMSAMS